MWEELRQWMLEVCSLKVRKIVIKNQLQALRHTILKGLIGNCCNLSSSKKASSNQQAATMWMHLVCLGSQWIFSLYPWILLPTTHKNNDFFSILPAKYHMSFFHHPSLIQNHTKLRLLKYIVPGYYSAMHRRGIGAVLKWQMVVQYNHPCINATSRCNISS